MRLGWPSAATKWHALLMGTGWLLGTRLLGPALLHNAVGLHLFVQRAAVYIKHASCETDISTGVIKCGRDQQFLGLCQAHPHTHRDCLCVCRYKRRWTLLRHGRKS